MLQAFFDGSTDDPADWVNASFAGERRVEFGSGEFGSGEFDDATNGTNATIPPRPGSEVGVGPRHNLSGRRRTGDNRSPAARRGTTRA